VDLLPPAYVAELKALQDDVPAFDDAVARAIVDRELGARAKELASLSPSPVAAASLGQVYRGKTREGLEVAVKVQRPDVLEGIALDLHLLRVAAPAIKRWQNLNSDLVGLVDEWGAGFVDELDYRREARNAAQFQAAMEARGLDAVCTAAAVPGLCTAKVLTTEWVEGERLEDSEAGDVSRLCGVALNAYLTMLLDTGVLHADPHPGNLLRTADGKLCILDWGLVAGVESERQYSLVDYIAHLVSEDYDAITGDLVALGFVPKGREAEIREAGVVSVLASVLKQLAGGGGAKKINVEGLAGELSNLTASYGNLFQIPTYFAYILRAFSILEGIGLASDPDYAIVQECYPYMARRLFTDKDPRTRQALQSMLYTKSGQLNVRRARKLSSGFVSFGESTAAPAREQAEVEQQLDQQLASLVFAPEGSYLQDVVIDEAVKAVDTLSREALYRLGNGVLGPAAAAALQQQRELARAAGPLGNLLFPLPAAADAVEAALTQGFAAKTSEDEANLETLEQLAELLELRPPEPASFDPTSAAVDVEGLEQAAARVNAVAPLVAAGLPAVGQRFTAAMLRRVADRAAGVHERQSSPAPAPPPPPAAASSTAGGSGPLRWTAAARREIDRAPFFVKDAAREKAERYARAQGATEVTLEIAKAAQKA